MADQKITELDEELTPQGDDVLAIVDVLAPETKKITLTGVKDFLEALYDDLYLTELNNLSDLSNVATARTNLGLVSGGAGDIWVEKAGDTMAGDLEFIDDLKIVFDTANLFTIGYSTGHGNLLFGGDGYFATVDGLHLAPNTNADGSGNWEPALDLNEDGSVQLANTSQGSAAARIFNINMTSGVSIGMGGLNVSHGITASNYEGILAANILSRIENETIAGSWNFSAEIQGDLGVNIATGQAYEINGVDVLDATTLGASVINSSLTNLGTLTGLTMAGNIVMGDNDITGISDLTFTDPAVGTINSIIANNLLSRIANESISGEYTFTNKVAIDGSADEVQLTIKGNATQLVNIEELQKSDGTPVRTTDDDGNTVFGVAGNFDSGFRVFENTAIAGHFAWDESAGKVILAGLTLDGNSDWFRFNGTTDIEAILPISLKNGIDLRLYDTWDSHYVGW